MLIRRAAQNALQKLAISKPDTKPATTYRRKPFITRVKNPRVKIFMGRVKIIRIGLKMALRIPKIKDANTSAFKFSIWIIPNMLATMKIDKAVMNHFNKKAFISYPFTVNPFPSGLSLQGEGRMNPLDLFIWKHSFTQKFLTRLDIKQKQLTPACFFRDHTYITLITPTCYNPANPLELPFLRQIG